MAQLFVISGSSGSGKTTLVYALLEYIPTLHRVITYTSRLKRDGEVDGYDYHFISDQKFLESIEKNFFIEWSNVYGNYYGSPHSLKENFNAGVHQIIITDPHGARAIKQQISTAILLWIDVESAHAVQQRLYMRGDEASEIILRSKELSFGMTKKDIKILYDYVISENNLKKMILRAKHIIQSSMCSSGWKIREKSGTIVS